MNACSHGVHMLSERESPAPSPSLVELAAIRHRFAALTMPTCTAPVDDLSIEPGTPSDYTSLARFHYKSGHPGAITCVWRMIRDAPTVVGRYCRRRDDTQTLGVLVLSLPALSCQLRNLATHDRYANLKPRDAAVMLNREVRTISRVVIDPQWRGLGLAVRLVKHALHHPSHGTGEAECSLRYIEALAAMGRVSPFFEQAGMTRYDRPPRAEHARLLDALRHLNIEPFMLTTRSAIDSRVTSSSASALLECELRRWHRAAHRTPPVALRRLSLDDLLHAARRELLAQPVYYIFRHRSHDGSSSST